MLPLSLALLILLVAALVLVELGQLVRAALIVVQAQLPLLLALVFGTLAAIRSQVRQLVLLQGPGRSRQRMDVIVPQMVRICPRRTL